MADLKLRSILDRWTACTITLEEAERELSDVLLAAQSATVLQAKQVAANIGRVEILCDTDPGGATYILVDGKELRNVTAITLQLRMRQAPLLAVELRP